MTWTIHVDEARVALVDGSGKEMSISFDELQAVHVYVDEVLGTWATTIELDFDNGHFLSLDSSMAGWDGAVRLLPRKLEVPESAWESALRSTPSDEPVTVWRRIA